MASRNLSPREESGYDSWVHGSGDFDDAVDGAGAVLAALAAAPPAARSYFYRKMHPKGAAPPRAESPPAGEVEDGPGPRVTFAWRGAVVDFGRGALRHRLVVALWDSAAGRPHPERQLEAVVGEVYGHDGDSDAAAVRELLSQVTAVLRRSGIRLRVTTRSGKVWLAEF